MSYNTLNLSDKRKDQNSERMLKIIEWSGLPVYAFAKSCKISSASSINNVIKKGVTPSEAVISKIVNRFPQLSYDWILTGSGTMLTISSDENSSEYSQKTSRDATFNQILKKLESHEMALEEVFKKSDSSIEKMNSIMLLTSENQAMTTLKFDKLINYFTEYVSKQEEQNAKAIKDFENLVIRLESSNNKNEKIIRDSLKDTTFLIEKLIETSMEAIKLGKQALTENKEALKEFGTGLEGYAKERDKKAEEITLVNVQKLFRQLVESPKKAEVFRVGTYTKAKKS